MELLIVSSFNAIQTVISQLWYKLEMILIMYFHLILKLKKIMNIFTLEDFTNF